MWHTHHIYTDRHWKLHSGPPLTGNALSQAITSSLTHSHLVFSVIWFSPKDHQKGFHRPNWQTLNSHLFLIGVRCLPFLPLKTSHHLASNKGKMFTNPLQKYRSNTDCTHFSQKHARTRAKAPRCKTRIYTWGCTRKSSRDGITLNDCKSKCSRKGGKWEVYLFQQPPSDRNVGNAGMTDLWSNLILIFSPCIISTEALVFPKCLAYLK